jgi:hypothetical protein
MSFVSNPLERLESLLVGYDIGMKYLLLGLGLAQISPQVTDQ